MYAVIYNTKYRRQFEAVFSKESWDNAKLKYGVAGAVVKLVKECKLGKKTKYVTRKRAKSLEAFIDGSTVAPEIYGAVVMKVGNNKKEVLDRGLGEFRVYSTRKGIEALRYTMVGRRRRKYRVVGIPQFRRSAESKRRIRRKRWKESARERRRKLYGYR